MSLRALAFAALLIAPFALSAQSFSTEPCPESDSGLNRWLSSGAHVCEIRRTTLPLVNGRVNVDGENGSIEVSGEPRQDIALEAKVTVQGGSQEEARGTLREITVDTQDVIHAHGPRAYSGHSWSVSYRLRAPHQVMAKLNTVNGSLTLSNLQGTIEANTINGGLKFDRLAGDVHAQTKNGGISAMLEGSSWQGSGLSATTTNGGISVETSPDYSAHLIASTVNGGVHVSRQNAEGVHGRNVDTQLGRGGATLIFQTTNGGISIR